MNHKFIFLFYCFLIITSCNKKSDTTAITNPNAAEPDENPIYQINLNSNSGSYLENVTIYWDETNANMKITDTDNPPNEYIISENFYDFTNMYSGQYKNINLEITVLDSTYTDKIQIYTRSVKPITDFTYTLNIIVEYDNKYDDGELFYDYIPNSGNGVYDNNGEYKEYFKEGNSIYNGGNNCICNNNSIPDGCTECYTDSLNNKYDEDDNETIIENGQFDEDDSCICINNSIPNGCTECYYDSLNNKYDIGENHIDCGIDMGGNSICENNSNWQNSFGNNSYDGNDNCICTNNSIPNGCIECYYDSLNNQYDIEENFREDGNYNGGDSCICSSSNSIPNGCTECYIDTLNEKYDSVDNEYFNEINEQFDEDDSCICINNSIPNGCTECYIDGNGVYDGNDNCICTDDNTVPNGCTECYIDGIPVYHRYLNWLPSTEPQTNFKQYTIYRAHANNKDELIDPSSCTNCEIIEIIETQTTNSYIDSTEYALTFADLNDFFYMIEVSTEKYTQNSYVQPNYLSRSDQITLNASTNKDHYIEINWIGQTISSDYFYQYEIQRASDIGGSIIEKNIIISDATIDHYIDRDVGDGTTKFYRIIVRYIDGTYSQPSEYVSGYSIP